MKKIKAFTLLETLIVIMVFCIGILVVVHGLSQTLRNKDYANTQIKSAFFAREGIELMFNLRDANYHKELPWNCVFQGSGYIDGTGCKKNFEPGTILKISMGSGNEYVHVETGSIDGMDFDDIFSGYQIYVHTGQLTNDTTGFYYDYIENEGEPTGFARYLLITGVVYNDNDKIIDKDKLLKIESHVLYQRLALTGEKVMETFIGNYDFKE